ncbi:C2 domain-containing protein [Klebsormidium nitens]|uniref:C2 domain-containing protein n=1 Tax=Klebsormidium nitens TaxID=105231 RepID=A0A1Y1IFQ4_KLENI|nr:C2 domain-containing protein [Klebsormidium nitens]|eukprot:GAQ87567.1 C2 domain-containing protein [Klebsormidium nitens]
MMMGSKPAGLAAILAPQAYSSGSILEAFQATVVPSSRELWFSFAAACAVILFYNLLRIFAGFNVEDRLTKLPEVRSQLEANLRVGPSATKRRETTDKMSSAEGDALADANGKGRTRIYTIKVELKAARNLVAANMNGTSDPYALLSCRDQKRFSSVVPSTRNPLWGETFEFLLDDLPAELTICLYDWDILWRSRGLGETTIMIDGEGEDEPDWYPLDKGQGQVQLQVTTSSHHVTFTGKDSAVTGLTMYQRRRRMSDATPALQREGTMVRQKPGPLQTIFKLPPDEIAMHTFSCAMERSFLYHGRMYVSDYHVCFNSNIFSKGIKVTIPFEDIEEIRKSYHALINPAVTIVLRVGAGGHGVPPLSSPDGRAKYKFASFWNRNHAWRVLQRSKKAYHELEKQQAHEERGTLLRASSLRDMTSAAAEAVAASPEVTLERLKTPPRPAAALEPFLSEEKLTEIIQDTLPITAADFFDYYYSDESDLTEQFRIGSRKDTNLQAERWQPSEQYGGLVRKVTFRFLCTSPMCPYDSAMTDWQHVMYDERDQVLTLEVISQAHDIPFASFFEVQNKFIVKTAGPSSCDVTAYTGVHFKKFFMLAGKIRSGALAECKDDWSLWLKLAKQELDRLKVDVPARRAEAQASGPNEVPVQDEFLGRDVSVTEFRLVEAAIEGESIELAAPIADV